MDGTEWEIWRDSTRALFHKYFVAIQYWWICQFFILMERPTLNINWHAWTVHLVTHCSKSNLVFPKNNLVNTPKCSFSVSLLYLLHKKINAIWILTLMKISNWNNAWTSEFLISPNNCWIHYQDNIHSPSLLV